MCRRRCRRGCGCWARAGRTRTTPTTPGRSRSRRCGHRRWRRCAARITSSVLRLLAKAQLDIGRARSRACSRLHALVRELVAGGIRKEIVVNQAEQLLAAIAPVNAAQRQRLELAHETPRRDPRPRRTAEALQGAHHRRRHRVGNIADRDLRGRADHRRDRHRLHRRHRPVPDRRALRRLQRHRPDRVLLIGAHRAPTVAARQPHVEPCDPHDRRHPDPPPRQRRPRLLRHASSPKAAHAAKRCAR